MPINSQTQISPGIGQLPDEFAPLGGCIIDIKGLNNARYTAQISSGKMFQGWVGSNGQFQSAPDQTKAWTVIATQKVLTSDVMNRLGGGIAAANIRITLYDGDSGSPNPVYTQMFGSGSFPYARWSSQPGNYDFDGGQNLYIGFEDAAGNPVNCGYMGATQTARLNSSNATVETFTGFPGVYALTDPLITGHTPPPAYLPPFPVTGWFSVPGGKLADLYNALLTGKLKIGLHDTTPGDQYLDFTQGLATDVISIPLFPPVVLSFVATPSSVVGSGDVVLSWTTQNCTSVGIPGVGSELPANGSKTVAVSADTTFNLTATGDDGSATASVHVTWSRPLPVIELFQADTPVLHAIGSSQVRWVVKNADSVTLNGQPVSLEGVATSTPMTEEGSADYLLLAVQEDTFRTASYTISVTLQAPPLVILTPNTLPAAGTTKLQYSLQFTADGGFNWDYHWSATGLPAGLTMSDSGLLSGTLPITATTTYNLTVTLSQAGVLLPKVGTFALPYFQAPLTITTAELTPARELENYSFQLKSVFGLGPKTWTLIDGTLPPNIALTTDGVLQGIPQNYGYWTFSVQVATATESDVKTYELMVKLGWARLDLLHHIFYRVRNSDGTYVQGATNDPFPERGGEIQFSTLAVGFSVGADEITLEDVRVRGGGLAKQFQNIPESANFWDLGHLDGAPYPIGGAAVVLLPVSLLDRFSKEEIQARVESIFPMGSLPVVRFVDQAGEEFVALPKFNPNVDDIAGNFDDGPKIVI